MGDQMKSGVAIIIGNAVRRVFSIQKEPEVCHISFQVNLFILMIGGPGSTKDCANL